MKILTRLVKGLCDLQQAAQEDDFLGRWAARCPRRVEAARTVAQRLQAGADPLPMGTCSVPVDQWPKLEDAYWRGMHDIKAFWTLYVANVIDEIDRKMLRQLLDPCSELLQKARVHDKGIAEKSNRKSVSRTEIAVNLLGLQMGISYKQALASLNRIRNQLSQIISEN